TALGDGLPRPDGIELPDGTIRLVGTVRFDGPTELIQTSYRENSRDDSLLPQVVPGPRSDPAMLYLADSHGVIRPVLLGLAPALGLDAFAAGVPPPVTVG